MWMKEAKTPEPQSLLYTSAYAAPSQHDPENSHQQKNWRAKNRAQQAPSRLVPEPFREFASNDIKMMRHARLTR